MKSWYEKEDLKGIQEQIFCGMEEKPGLAAYFNALSLLEEIPMEYLCCEEALLPPEAIRFFYIDENWIDSLLDGVLSIGRNTRADMLHDVLLQKKRQVSEEKAVRTGFLLRSKLVRGWQGLEVEYYGEYGKLRLLRSAKIADDTMICIVDGKITQLELIEPAEGIHFECIRNEQGTYDMPFREENGVLDIEKLATSLGKEEEITALELAKELMKTFAAYSVKGELL